MAKTRGRKSADSQTVKPILQFVRKLPEQLAHLTAAQQETWRLIVASPAGAMIDTKSYPVLVEFCRAAAAADAIAVHVDRWKPEWLDHPDGLKR